MADAVCTDRAILSQAGQWPPTGQSRAGAAVSIFCNGSSRRTRRFTIRPQCDASSGSTSAASRCRELVPDETTVCRFGHLLEEHDLGRPLFEEVQRRLAAKGVIARGTIVDATIFDAPSSTKNADTARDPEMHQTKQGNQWYFGMKVHVGVDSRSKLIHAVVVTQPMSPTARYTRAVARAIDPGVG